MAAARPGWRAVAVPSEHGGWGLTIEPVVLGLLVEPSWAGAALGLAAVIAFVTRTPAKIVLVDRSRGRWLDRTGLAARIGLVEVLILVALLIVAAVTARGAFWVPLAIAGPLIALELGFGMRSRSRRLAPELAGTIGIGSVAAAIVLAGGGAATTAAGAWVVVTARAVASVPFSRLQVRRWKGQVDVRWPTELAQLGAVIAVVVAWQIGWLPIAAPIAVVSLVLIQLAMLRAKPPRPPILGVQQMILGLAVVVTTAIGINAA